MERHESRYFGDKRRDRQLYRTTRQGDAGERARSRRRAKTQRKRIPRPREGIRLWPSQKRHFEDRAFTLGISDRQGSRRFADATWWIVRVLAVASCVWSNDSLERWAAASQDGNCLGVTLKKPDLQTSAICCSLRRWNVLLPKLKASPASVAS